MQTLREFTSLFGARLSIFPGGSECAAIFATVCHRAGEEAWCTNAGERIKGSARQCQRWGHREAGKSWVSGGMSENKTLRASTGSAAEPDKVRAESLAKVVKFPLVKYFKVKSHADMAAKPKIIIDNNNDKLGNVEPKVNKPFDDCVTDREEETSKEPPLIEKADDICTPVCVNLSTKEADVGNNLGKVNDSVSADILAQAEVQAMTQVLVLYLSTLNIGAETQKGEQTRLKRRPISKSGQDLDLGDRIFTYQINLAGLVMRLWRLGRGVAGLVDHPGPKQYLR
ncbi:hypothetical protein NDU88_007817 [Pleurodeles waltl]|uniref:Uncharacterized protein n=1 Tax=Pleurodeles waltl TaxID=8319 RepID=A0AAV7QPW9_PLEWA|nr:hypothetical protein NDU88_007817 [Pleurodeles waltl]